MLQYCSLGRFTLFMSKVGQKEYHLIRSTYFTNVVNDHKSKMNTTVQIWEIDIFPLIHRAMCYLDNSDLNKNCM